MNFSKECISGDGLKRTTWSFMLFDNYNELCFVLNNYCTYQKDTIRKKNWNRVLNYDRLSKRDSNIEETDVPIPVFINNEIIDYLHTKISIKKWSEYKK